MLTHDERNYAQWRIQVWRFMLQARLTSENAIVRHDALDHAAEAAALQSVLDTPPERYTPVQAAWSKWIASACALYHTARQEPGYWQQADYLREQRDTVKDEWR